MIQCQILQCQVLSSPFCFLAVSVDISCPTNLSLFISVTVVTCEFDSSELALVNAKC